MATNKKGVNVVKDFDTKSWAVFRYDNMGIYCQGTGFSSKESAEEYAASLSGSTHGGYGISEMIGVVKPKVVPYEFVSLD